MEEVTQLSLSPTSDTESDLLDGLGQRLCRLRGVVLEKAFLLKDGRFLVISTDDCPYEEGIHVALVWSGGAIDEQITRLHAYHGAVLTEVRPVTEHSLQLIISDQEKIVITINFDGFRKPLEFASCGFTSDWKPFQLKFLTVVTADS